MWTPWTQSTSLVAVPGCGPLRRMPAATHPATVARTLQGMVRHGRAERAPEGGYRIAAAARDTAGARYRFQPLGREGNGNR